MKKYISTITLLPIFLLVLLLPKVSYAAILSLSPSTGNFFIGSTFDVSILLDTQGKSINALSVSLNFPPDMLQIVSPSTGQSIIGVWTAAPKFDNLTGRLDLQGGIPGGITTSNALVSKITFRVKSVGRAIVKFLDSSKVLLNDGLGTNDLDQALNANFTFKLPPPAGPIVTSDTNPDQATWYPNRTVTLHFLDRTSSIDGFSYILSDDSTTIPDNINEGTKNSIFYTNLTDGVHYFHIKSLRGGVWGGVTHFAIKVDATPPSDFKIDIAPSSHTTSRQPVIQFITTDTLSGMDRYDLKIVPLSSGIKNESTEKNSRFFIETTSTYIPFALALGNYDVIVRAYDKSNNFREVTERLYIVTPIFTFIVGTGIRLGGWIIPWTYVVIAGLLFLILLFYVAYRARVWRHKVSTLEIQKKLPGEVSRQLEELKKYRAKYGTVAIFLILTMMSIFYGHSVNAGTAQLAPPLISTISKNISNEEIFYMGGKTDFANEQVLIYIQNLATGETFSENADSDNRGNWFYRHTNFLSPGNYLLWAQGKVGEEISPPGPQVKMTVNRTAVQFGGSNLSYETIYLVMIILLLILVFGLLFYIGYHIYHGRKKHKIFKQEVQKAEESIRRGFAVLRRDIESELALVRRAGLSAELSIEEKEKESQLLLDLNMIQKRLGKEIWEIGQEAS